ncbi:SDR family oxidoreductase [Streptomyces lavendulocolor]|uniref:SDR family oxidoreductase n=1 Tax=Streptomyces lavendulocolor TaxID=67316 RepID=UPI0033CDEA05
MTRELEGKIAVVTGGGKGVGRAICLLLAMRGAHVIVNYFHSEDAALATVSDITARGGTAEAVKASVASKSSVREMFSKIGDQHGGIDVLINNAARGIGRCANLPDEEWEKALKVNLQGSRWCSEFAAPLLAKRAPSAIVNVSAIGAGWVMPDYAPGGVAKAAVESLTRYLAVEYAPMQIRVNAASASLIDSETSRKFLNGTELRKTVIGATPLRRLATEEELAELSLFLASDRASYITGQIILADGGLTLASASLAAPSEESRAAGAAAAQPERSTSRTTTKLDSAVNDPDRLVVVVGAGLTVPGANSPSEFWELLNRPREVFTEPGPRFVLENFWSADPKAPDRTYSRVGGYIHDFSPHPQLLAEEQAEGAIRDEATRWLRHSFLQARDGVCESDSDRCAVFVGGWPGGSQSLGEYIVTETFSTAVAELAGSARGEQIRQLLHARYPRVRHPDVPLLPEMVLRRAVAGLQGRLTEALVVDTACSSSMYAVDLGVKALLAGDCDVAYCGGVEAIDPSSTVMFAKIGGLTADGRVRSLDTAANGTLFSDGASMLTLKRYSRALADGDNILGVLLGFGASADGRGKAIAAPNPHGQRLAIGRARAVNRIPADDVDWIIAHATGTAAGDSAELEALASLAPAEGYLCTSNKATIGHTGWAAGTVSLIHGLLALKHQSIPAQHAFKSAPSNVDGKRIHIPASDSVPFPAKEGMSRTVAISGFGFGGTNGHQLVADRPGRSDLVSGLPQAPGGLALVAWSAHLPGSPSPDEIRAWLRSGRPSHDRAFGVPYPPPSPASVRLTPQTIKSIDPCHLMAIQVAAKFVEEHGELWAGHQHLTGVITAHTGVPRGLSNAIVRCYAHDVIHACDEAVPGSELPSLIKAAVSKLGARIPRCNEDTQAGVMTNVISSRVTGRYDLNGISMTVAAGEDSTLAALNVAERYLGTGELDLALILAVNGNSNPTVSIPTAPRNEQLAEGAFLLAVTTMEMAKSQNWPILARLESVEPGTQPTPSSAERHDWDYLGASGAVTLLQAVERKQETNLTAATFPSRIVRIIPPVPQSLQNTRKTATQRYRRVLVPSPPSGAATSSPDRPAGGGLVLVASNKHLDSLVGDQLTVITTDPDGVRPGTHLITNLDAPETVRALHALIDKSPASITVVADFSCSDWSWPGPPAPALLRLHDLLLVATQRLTPRWSEKSSLAVLLSSAADGTRGPLRPHPHAALFTGFVKSLAWERPSSPIFALLTDVGLPGALGLMEQERAEQHNIPVIWNLRGARHSECLTPAPLRAVPERALPVTDASHVLVTGGAGGLSVAMLEALARHARPHIWLLGRTEISGLPPELAGAEDAALPAMRRNLIRQFSAESSLPIRTVIEKVERLLRSRAVHQACVRLRRSFGDDRVHYLACDIRDRGATEKTVSSILATGIRIDAVLHAAGVFKPALAADKEVESYRDIRDTKLLGYHNLKASLSPYPLSLWCNIGSATGAYGTPGDTDYASTNDFLAAASMQTAGMPGRCRELTISFPLWSEAGFGADALNRSYLNRLGRFTPISNDEGTHIFLAELADAEPGTESVYLGDRERRLFTASRPGYIIEAVAHEETKANESEDVTGPYLRQQVALTSSSGSWKCRFDEDRDGYLHHHLVDGKPTVPGTLMLEIAAEASETLHPGLHTTGFRNARFDAFIRPFAGRGPLEVKIIARTVDSGSDPTDEVHVQVALESDPIRPLGRVASSKRHFQVEVVLSSAPPSPAPTLSPLQRALPRLAVSDPYYQPDSPVQLSGVFKSTVAARAGVQGTVATWKPDFDTADPFPGTRIPWLLLDAALRTIALRPVSDRRQAVYVPRGIEKVNLYAMGANDAQLSQGRTITLSTADKGDIHAFDQEERLLLRISGITAEQIGSVAISTADESHRREGNVQL